MLQNFDRIIKDNFNTGYKQNFKQYNNKLNTELKNNPNVSKVDLLSAESSVIDAKKKLAEYELSLIKQRAILAEQTDILVIDEQKKLQHDIDNYTKQISENNAKILELQNKHWLEQYIILQEQNRLTEEEQINHLDKMLITEENYLNEQEHVLNSNYNRDKNNNNTPKSNINSKEDIILSSSDSKELSLSILLNLLDGLYTREGIISFFTTNHIDRLDDAFLRDGRMDIKIELKDLDNTTANKMILDKTGLSNVFKGDCINPSTLQELIIRYKLNIIIFLETLWHQ